VISSLSTICGQQDPFVFISRWWMDSSSRQRDDTAKNEKQVRRSRQKRHNTVWVSKFTPRDNFLFQLFKGEQTHRPAQFNLSSIQT
jgi:hypothetical protein